MIDYEEIIEQLDIEKIKNLLDRLEVPYQDKGAYLVCKTACHNADLEDASDKLYYYDNTHIFYCYTHCNAMSIFKFLKSYYETRDIEYDWVEDIYNVVLDCSRYDKYNFQPKKYKTIREKYEVQKEIELPKYNEGALGCFIKWYPVEWLNDGISKAAMDKYEIRYSISQNKIIIPHRDIEGNLVGIRGRALNPEEVELFGKYMPVKLENTWYTHPLSMNLYGLYQNKENIKKNRICFIAEAEKSVMQAESFSRDNCVVSVCGSQLNKFSLKKLINECRPEEIVICFDKEDNTNDIYFNKLYTLGKKYQNYANFSFIFDFKGLLELKDSPFDKGEKIFEELLERRVKIR